MSVKGGRKAKCFMKRVLFIIIAAFVSTLCLSSCGGTHSALSSNTNVSATQVVLSKNNYKIVDKLEGSSSTVSIFGIGNHGMRTLVANARADMLKKANLIGTSRAVINENIEINKRMIFFVMTRTVNTSAYLIEFTDEEDDWGTKKKSNSR
ncbi:hypothetical protein FACS1894156_0750 [Bacteroidia bacterium]|nr:hypothetical protein FACS1894156_0750 [Bacteroidia bacterium]